MSLWILLLTVLAVCVRGSDRDEKLRARKSGGQLMPRAMTEGETPQYLVEVMYHWGSNCAGDAQRTESSAFGSCIGGNDPQGNPTSSSNSIFQSYNATSNEVTFIRNSFKSSDCSGAPAYSGTTVQPLNKCESDTMYVLTSADDKEPWLAEAATPSVIVYTYPYAPVAPGPNDYPEIFQAIAFSYCMGYSDPKYPTATNLQYTACDDDTITFTMYSDACTTAVSTVSFPANTYRVCPIESGVPGSEFCYPQGYWYNNFEKMTCRK
eukprot:gene12811-9158_t